MTVLFRSFSHRFLRFFAAALIVSCVPVLAFSQSAGVDIGPGEGVEFYQLDFPDNTPPVTDSSVGMLQANLLLLRESSGMERGYVNVIIDNNWVVRNMVILSEAEYPYSHLSVQFDLGVSEGTDVTILDAEVVFSEEIQENAPFSPPQSFDVEAFSVSTGGMGVDGDRSNAGDSTPPVISYNFGGPKNDRAVAQLDHPNIEAALNQCYPMAVANSLQFLEITAGLPVPHDHKIGLKGDDSLVGQIGQFMNRQTTSRLDPNSKGVADERGLQGKLEYLARNGLEDRVVTRHWGRLFSGENVSVTIDGKTATSSFGSAIFTHDEIMKSLARGEDCEAAYSFPNGGHAIDLVGAGVTNGVPWITEASDLDQKSDIKGAGPSGFRFWQLEVYDNEENEDDPFNGYLVMGGSNRVLDMLICQKVVEPPPELPPFIPFIEPVSLIDLVLLIPHIGDTFGHLCCLMPEELPPPAISIFVDGTQMEITDGSTPWLPAMGPPPGPDGTFLLESTSTVAGFPNVRTEISGQFFPTHAEGIISVGAPGLPGGPIDFHFEVMPPGPPGSLWPHLDPLPPSPLPDPVPVIRVNGFTGMVHVEPFDPISIGVGVNANGHDSQTEFWVVATSGDQIMSYDPMSRAFVPGLFPSAEGPLTDIPHLPLFFDPTGLPALVGPVDLHFGLDFIPDGIPSLDNMERSTTSLFVEQRSEEGDTGGSGGSGGTGGTADYITNPGSGNCVPWVSPAQGTVAQYKTTTNSSEGTIILNYQEEWLAVSPTEVTTRNTQSLVLGPATTDSVSVTTQTLSIVDGLLFIPQTVTEVSATTTVGGFPVNQTLQTITITTNPHLFAGPADEVCEGMVWTVPVVTETEILDPDPLGASPLITDTIQVTTEVLSVSEQVSVPAGSFTTVHTRSTTAEGTVENWTDRTTGLLVKSQVSIPGEGITAATELQSLTSP